MLGQKVYKYPELGRGISTGWPQRAKRFYVFDVIYEDAHESPIGDLSADCKIRDTSNTKVELGHGN